MTWNPDQLGARSRPAWDAAVALLDDNQWHPWPEITAAMNQASDLEPKSVTNLLYNATTAGYLIRKGRGDHRQIRIHPFNRTP